MTVNKGFLSLVNSSPNFSNQALENAVNDIKAVDQDDTHQFILSQFSVDTAIRTNIVLSTSQKNDALETLFAEQPHLHIGRILTDVVRHTATIIDASIIPLDDATNPTPATFLELLQEVQTIQGLVPEVYGVPAADKGRSVNDHVGTLNNIFLTSEDSTKPVFTRLKEIMELIDATSRANTVSGLNLAIANVAVGNNNLTTFLNGLEADSTDFQQSLDDKINLAANKYSALQTKLALIPGDPTTDLVEIKDDITNQVSLENSNLTSIRTYIETLSSNIGFATLAEDVTLRRLMSKVAQNKNWQTYFEQYETNKDNLNGLYNTDTPSDNESVIDQVLADSGLPDVTDSSDFEAVAGKAKRDTRIDTAGYDRFSIEKQIIESCKQLGITTANRTLSSLSGTLLRNMNQHDRDEIQKELDLNQSANTLS